MLEPLAFPIDSIVDTDGRPLREHSAPLELQKGVPMELIECSYPGSRYKHKNPMNISALRQMTEHWDELISGLLCLRNLYVQSSNKVRLIDLWRIGMLGEILPQYLTYRAHNPVSHSAMPPFVAAIYKVMIGLNTSIFKLAQTTLLSSPDTVDQEVDPEKLFAFVESDNLLIGVKQVCAGPEGMIRKAIRLLVTGAEAPPNSEASNIKLIGDTKAFLEFSWCIANEKILSALYFSIVESLYGNIWNELSKKLGEKGNILFPISGNSHVFLNVSDEMIKSSVEAILQSALVRNCYDGERLHACAMQIVRIFSDENFITNFISKDVCTAIEANRIMSPSLQINTYRYLALEKIRRELSSIIKSQCLKSLGLSNSIHLTAMARQYLPASHLMSHFLGGVLGYEISSDLHIFTDNVSIPI